MILNVVGLGPGNSSCLTPQALAALKEAKVIVGYSSYLELLDPELIASKTILSSGMRKERERCEAAINSALIPKNTCLVSSGDPGIYALAGLTLELLEARKLLDEIQLQVIPGVPALTACAALLGAPLGHDFACISLSDLLTPLDKIWLRLCHAAQADFVLVLYNPRSKGRPDYLAKALDLVKKYRPLTCPVGIVRKAYRPGQEARVYTLGDFDPRLADMLSLIIIGNS
ncbi:MAG: precorrin-3B C(17)-methyltransferase, partial [Desulfovibrionaceae bacterium]|nr:precorrin-3B C(17)-methyltransferase [Desulfovibrionaceae bacterium]